MKNINEVSEHISILYVEDTISAQREFSDILSIFVDEVNVASNGEEGLQMYKELSPDIIITDIQMPVMNGLDMIKEIRSEDTDTPIIITSAFNDNSYLFDAIELGIEHYLLKPIIVDKLEERLDTIIRAIMQKRELKSYQDFLEEKIQKEMILREEKESLLLQQNKSSEIGHMVGVIAHQWKQPLNYLNMLIEDIGLEYEYQPLSKEYINDFIKKGTSKVEFLTTTMDNFLNFYKSENTSKTFLVSHVVNEIISFLNIPYKALGISIIVEVQNDFKISGIENEFQQVVLNLITNAKEAFDGLNKADSQIVIKIDSMDNIGSIQILDNATGFDTSKIDKIFDLEYTTKQDGNGIGLYLVNKVITQRFNGSIEALNLNNGACFKITLNIGKNND
ncbi:response regulator [Sulfurimonas sp.]|nr:response regulator [Sulfurimonas sp.]